MSAAPFWFHKSHSIAFPLCALPYDVQHKLNFRDVLADLIKRREIIMHYYSNQLDIALFQEQITYKDYVESYVTNIPI